MVAFKVLGAAALIVAAAGCGGGPLSAPDGVDIKGKVLLSSGSPLKGGTLVLRPEEGIYGASARIQKDGSFYLADAAGRKSVVPGKYQVYVLLNAPNQKGLRASVAKKYQNSEDGDSDVFVEIGAARSDLIIRLKR